MRLRLRLRRRLRLWRRGMLLRLRLRLRWRGVLLRRRLRRALFALLSALRVRRLGMMFRMRSFAGLGLPAGVRAGLCLRLCRRVRLVLWRWRMSRFTALFAGMRTRLTLRRRR
jgi:hypothetical protein